jgi:poly(A) polymerase
LLYRYASTDTGKLIRKAEVYTLEDHHLDRNLIDPDALRVINRLRSNGHEAYIVGGAVRDMLLGKSPKDFDITTDALPGRIHRLFWNSRIIGKRFRLVHIFFGEKIFEIATFRSLKDGTSGNTYGSMDEDVLRRDFSMNALYYCPRDQTIVDYVHGLKDIRAKRLKPVIPLNIIFSDDPVRMIRAVKYAATTGFSIPFWTRMKIKSCASLLAETSSSRRTEEILKILNTGSAEQIFRDLRSFGLLAFLLPTLDSALAADESFVKSFLVSMAELDRIASGPEEVRKGRQLAFLIRDHLQRKLDWTADPVEVSKAALAEVRDLLTPMNPPRIEAEHAVRLVFREMNVPMIKKAPLPQAAKSAPGSKKNPPPQPKQVIEGEAVKHRRRRRHKRKAPGTAGVEGSAGTGAPGPASPD